MVFCLMKYHHGNKAYLAYMTVLRTHPGNWSHLAKETHLGDKEQGEGKINGGIPPVCCQLKVKAVFIQPFQLANLIPSEIAEEVVDGFLLSKL